MMKWIEVFYPEHVDPFLPKEMQRLMATDLECSECGHHVHPPQNQETCPRCGAENDDNPPKENTHGR